MLPVRVMRIRSARTILIATLALLISQPAGAGQVFMLNGDVLTGEIKKIWDEKLTFEPEYSDEFAIDLDKIAYLESDREFDVEFPDGREVKAKLVGGSEGTQVLEIDGITKDVPVMQLAELDEPEDYKDWDTYIDVNSLINKGNTDSEQASLQFRTNYKLGDHRHLGELSFSREEQSGVSIKEQDRATYAYNWSFNEPWFLGLNLAAERDPIRELDYRISGAGGVGYNIWDDADRFFQIQVFAGFMKEDIAMQINESAIAGWIFRFRYDIIDDLEFFHDHNYSANITGRDNEVFKSQTGLRFEITDLIYANFQFDYDHESQPAPGIEKEDLTMMLGIGVEL